MPSDQTPGSSSFQAGTAVEYFGEVRSLEAIVVVAVECGGSVGRAVGRGGLEGVSRRHEVGKRGVL